MLAIGKMEFYIYIYIMLRFVRSLIPSGAFSFQGFCAFGFGGQRGPKGTLLPPRKFVCERKATMRPLPVCLAQYVFPLQPGAGSAKVASTRDARCS